DVSAPDAAVAAEHAPARRPRRPMRFGNTSVTTIDGPPWRVSQLACTAHLPEALVTHLSRRSEQ
ncbi:MAG: hypothetical protein KDK91_28145, partial [Gammaproteobacteria bacterium]|nr:hypothetical protein [Gammaproteobacteria bacterium]